MKAFNVIKTQLADPSFQLYLPGQPAMALDEAIGAATVWRTAFSDFGLNQHLVVKVEDAGGLKFAVVIDDRLTHDGVFIPLGPDGPKFMPTFKEVRFKRIEIIEVNPEGKMLALHVEFNPESLLSQLG